MSSRARSDKLDRLVVEVTAALNTLQRSLPELVQEAKIRGGDEVRRRILEAASEGLDTTTTRLPQRTSRGSVSSGLRGFIVPVIARVLKAAGTSGLTDDELYARVQQEADREVKRNSYKMALARRIEAGHVVEIDGTLFSAEHADKATAVSQEGAQEPSQPAPEAHDNSWNLMRNNDAAA